MLVLRRLYPLAVMLGCLAAACSPLATPEVATEPPPTTAPTHTPKPTATQPPTDTTTPTPLPPTDTPTPVPPTKTPRPTATFTPGPGEVFYQPAFETDWRKWDYFYFGSDEFTVDSDNEILNINIDSEDTFVYGVYVGPANYDDVQIDVDVTVVSGPNRNNLSIICRQSDLGWYEFNILSGGLWSINKYDENISDYRALGSGGSTAIKSGQNLNHLTATCIGDTLTFYINDVKVGTARDGAFTEGTFGVSASTFSIGDLNARFSDLTVRRANPDAALGQAVAPTVPPGFGSSEAEDNPWDNYFAVPLPGESLANAPLQFKALGSLSSLILPAIPDNCQDFRVTNTAVQQIVKPFVFNDQGRLIEGEWVELWTLNVCGAVSNWQVRFIADGTGNIVTAVMRAS